MFIRVDRVHECNGQTELSQRVARFTTASVKTSSSAVAKRPRDASCLSAANFNNTKRPAQSFYCQLSRH